MTEKILYTEKLTKKYGDKIAISEIDFELHKGEVRAVIGANGAGKSTFVKLIFGEIIAESGAIYLKGKKVNFKNPADALNSGIAMVPQDFGLIESMSIAENLLLCNLSSHFLFYSKNEIFQKVKNILNKLSITLNPNKIISELTVAEKQLVSIAKALFTNAEIIIFDEPTSVLNINSFEVIKKIIKELKFEGKSIIYITHKLDEIFEIADNVTIFLDSKIALDAEINSIQKDDLLKFFNFSSKQIALSTKFTESRNLLEVTNLTTSNLYNISFDIKQGESIGIRSNNYLESIELAEAIFGSSTRESGSIKINNVKFSSPYTAIKNKIGFIPEDRRNDGIFSQFNIIDNLSILNIKYASSLGLIDKSELIKVGKTIIESLKIKCQSLFQPIVELSGGNQQKVLFGRWIINDFDLLILLEPTAGIDLGGKSEIHSIIKELKNKGKSFLIVSADSEELNALSDKILIIANGKLQSIIKS